MNCNMKHLLTILLILFSLTAIGQQTRFNQRSDVKIGDSAQNFATWAGKYASPYWVWTNFVSKTDLSGTSGKVAVFTGTSTLSTGSMYDDGSKVGVNNNAPVQTLDITGSLGASGSVFFGGIGTTTTTTEIVGYGTSGELLRIPIPAGEIEWTDTIATLATKYDLDTLADNIVYTETDPIYALDSAYIVRFGDTLNAIGTKYDIDTLSFLRSFTEVDPVFALDSAAILHWYDSIAKIATKYDLDTLADNIVYTETDPVWLSDSSKYTLKNGYGATGYWDISITGTASKVSTGNVSSNTDYYPTYTTSSSPIDAQLFTISTMKFNPATGVFNVPTLSLPSLTKQDTALYIMGYTPVTGVTKAMAGSAGYSMRYISGKWRAWPDSVGLTANQTITLSGDVSGSGTTAITTTVADDSHNHVISNVDALQDSITRDYAITKAFNAAGDLIVGSGNNTFSTLTKGSNQQVLKMWSGVVGWHADSVGEGGSGVPADSLAWVKGTANVYLRDTTDKVGIGTTIPNRLLTLRHATVPTIGFNKAGTEQFIFGYDGTIPYLQTLANNPMVFYNDNAEVMRYTDAGNVGIGTTSPGSMLHLKKADTTHAYLTIGSKNREAGIYLVDDGTTKWSLYNNGGGSDQFLLYNHAGSATALAVLSNGNVGINTLNPDERLVVVGASTTGKYTSSGWTHSSDSTMKDSIREIKNVLGKLKKLQGVKYVWKDEVKYVTISDTTGFKLATVKADTTWKDSIYITTTATGTTTVSVKVIDKIRPERIDTIWTIKTKQVKDTNFIRHKQLGFIAQSVEKVIPEAVRKGDDGKYSIADGQILPIVVEAAKELSAEIDTLNDLTISTQIITPDTNGIKRGMIAKTMYISLNAPVVLPKGKQQIANGKIDGQEITLVGMHNTNNITIHDGDNVQLSTATITLKKYQTLTLIYAAPLNTWLEKARSLN